MPGTSYDKLGRWISKWLEKIPESKIQTNTESVRNSLKNIHLDQEENLISFDVTQLYTNVPVNDSIELAATKLYNLTNEVLVDAQTFVKLAKLACTDI